MENPDPNYEQDIDESIEENVELSNEAQEDYAEDNSPTYSKADDLYSLFWKTINIQDSSKVANLDIRELGMLSIAVRDCQHIANTAKILDEHKFAEWMTEQGQIILRTSASKKGWLTELFVTAKRFASKERRLGIAPQTQQPKSKSFWEKIKQR